MKFKTRKPHFEHLRKKWIARHRAIKDNFWALHGESLKKLALSSIGSLMLLSPQTQHQSLTNLTVSRAGILKDYDQNVLLAQIISDKLPKEVRLLSSLEEKVLTDILTQQFGFKVTTEINGIRLNRSFGLIGGEQHLYRYPADTLFSHAESTVDWAKYGSAGIAPHLGAWGYFAYSRQDLTEIDKLRERYYLAIQTFLVPGYAENADKFRDFFKYRKMLVVNPKTGQAVVAVIADAGPSEWTGKHLGGSPEVMDVLGLAEGSRKGAVLYFFLNDPNDEIPLGPVRVKDQA